MNQYKEFSRHVFLLFMLIMGLFMGKIILDIASYPC